MLPNCINICSMLLLLHKEEKGRTMKEKVYVTGHKNPDTDSICAAISYAELKNKIGEINAIPIRIGELNQETRFVLDRWGFEAPPFISTLKQTVKDLELDEAFTVTKNISINKAARFLQEQAMQTLPVVDDNEALEGIVTLSNLTKSYMEVWDDKIIWRANTSIDNIIDVIAANIVHLPIKLKPYDGRIVVYVSEVDEKGHVAQGDIVVSGNRKEVQLEAINRGAAIIILSSSAEMSPEVLERAKESNVTVLSTKYNSYMVARLLPQSIPISYVMTKDNLISFYPDDFIEYVEKEVRGTRIRNFPVIDHNGRVISNLSRSHLMVEGKKKVILVDHNERNQSIDDFDSVEIVEIIDHHRVANIITNNPIYFRNLPVGSSNTIIAMMYFEQGITPSKNMAGLMASAIISDTLLFRSPTTTETDKQILMRLARIADIDVEAYSMEMFSAGTSLKGKKPEDILNTDCKVFNINDNKVKVAQTFTTNLGDLGEIEDKVKVKMNEIQKFNQDDVFCLLMTDIFAEKSKVLIAGKYGEEIAKEFGAVFDPKGFIVDGLLSRKKQFIPTISAAISKVTS